MNALPQSFQALALTLLAALTCAPAAAQLKAPRNAPPVVPDRSAAPASQAPANAPPATGEATEKEAAGTLAAAGWLVLLDRRDWGRAWETSAAIFRATVPLGTWMDNIPKVREPLGALVERQPAESMYRTQLEGRPDGEYVSVAFTSKFDKEQLRELITTVREPDGRWRVTGYSTR